MGGVSGTEIVRSFSYAKDAPREVRRIVTHVLEGRRLQTMIDEAAVVATELATNAVMHARVGFTLRIVARPERIHIAVEDPEPSLPVRRPEQGALGGHGLHLVQALAARWGAERTAEGKVVWAELERTPA